MYLLVVTFHEPNAQQTLFTNSDDVDNNVDSDDDKRRQALVGYTSLRRF